MNDLDRLESAFALEEFMELRSPYITGCTYGNEQWHDADLNTCRNRAALEGTGGELWQVRRPICISHAMVVSRTYTTAHASVCARPTRPGQCCATWVTVERPCPDHGPITPIITTLEAA